MKEYRNKEIYGNLYENEGKSLVVIINGSRPGIPEHLNERLMDYLKYNYSILLLAYYGVGDLPKSLERIPIEYFVNAINFFKENLGLNDDQVIIIGNSKGGEAALVISNYFQSAITIACVPGCYVFQGLPEHLYNLNSSEPKSSWSLNNKELPYIKFYIDRDVLEDAKNKNFCRCYEKSIEVNFNKDALISLDRYKGRILLLSSENDKYWPSKKMSDILVKNSKSTNNISHISLNLEGHYFLNYEESVNEIINFLNSNNKAVDD